MNASGLKREYMKLLRISNTQLKRELKKPEAEQDLDLINECLESAAYCRKELEALRPARSASSLMPVLRRAAVFALVLIVGFSAFATVSQAAGLRVWTAIFKWDAGYLKVDYVPEPTEAPAYSFPEWEDNEISFFEAGRFNERLVSDGLEPIASEEGQENARFIEGSIRSTKRDYYASYTLQGELGTVRVRMIAKSGEPTPVTVWGMDERIPVTETEVNGVPVSYQTEQDGCVFATWQAHGCIFCASLFDPAVPAEEILNDIVR